MPKQKEGIFSLGANHLALFSDNAFCQAFWLGGLLFSKLKWLMLLAMFFAQSVSGVVWIEADDWRSRQDVFRLADAGVITSTVSTFPMPWDAIRDELIVAQETPMKPSQAAAVNRLIARFESRRTGVSGRLFSAQGNNEGLTKTETDSFYGRGETGVVIAGRGNKMSAALQISAVHDADSDQDRYSFDGSFAVSQLGNWLLGGGYIAQKFGPGLDTQLVRSVSARALPTIYFSRNSSEPVDLPIVSWLGSWTFMNSVSWMDDDRAIDDALLWTIRAAFRPVSFLEVGISKAAQLCGEGKSCNASQWRRTLAGDTNVWSGENPANQIASIDLRFSRLVAGLPAALYWESMGEDAFRPSDFPPFQAKSNLLGASLDIDWHRFFLEVSETGAWCSGSHNCTYEHSAYRSGYRYHGRTLGSAYDNDTKSYVLGYRATFNDKTFWTLHARYLDLNFDNSNSSAPGGNPISAERLRVRQLDGSYGFSLRSHHFDFGDARFGFELSLIDESTGSKFENLEKQFWFEWNKAL